MDLPCHIRPWFPNRMDASGTTTSSLDLPCQIKVWLPLGMVTNGNADHTILYHIWMSHYIQMEPHMNVSLHSYGPGPAYGYTISAGTSIWAVKHQYTSYPRFCSRAFLASEEYLPEPQQIWRPSRP
ncbi:unnamed protein product [Microthlaspi erraticum]|uniref:Uncharacterized protein n=1 Tax=Microthlaspi erraticum TaxID=1685480 RepID=A0A6D2HFE7_9BRAS|nr:unnamed protein product [Microthlaspi erraticum]